MALGSVTMVTAMSSTQTCVTCTYLPANLTNTAAGQELIWMHGLDRINCATGSDNAYLVAGAIRRAVTRLHLPKINRPSRILVCLVCGSLKEGAKVERL